jgi:hypothetical protein
MPSPAGSRGKVTDRHAPIEVGSFEVRRVGDVVALNFGTPHGEFTYLVRERPFVKEARGEFCRNGHPFRTLEQIEEERRQKQEDAKAERSSPRYKSRLPAAATDGTAPLLKPSGRIL